MRSSRSPRPTLPRSAAVTAVLALSALGLSTAVPPASGAVPRTPPPVLQPAASVVTADALPTAQINGIVWKQAIAGNTVFAGGKFSSARPAGAAPGSRTVARANLMSYDIRTGRMSSFAPRLDGQVRALALSPDKRILYVGGDFRKVNGKNRPGLAAFTVATGALRPTTFGLNNRVNAIVAMNNTVYFGGWFTRVGSNPRMRLAAFTASTGRLTGWAPKANGSVEALVATPDKKRIIIGGAFETLNGATNLGMGAVTTGTGRVGAWKINQKVKNAGSRAAVLDLAADADTVYGVSYGYERGNFEGVFAARPSDGTIKWLQDCHGDQYGVAPVGNLVYSVGHAHHCRNIGGFGEISPQRALVVSRDARGTVATNSQPGLSYGNWAGYPAPALYNWFPKLNTGTVSGSSQGAWSIEATSKYVVVAGEFTTVNGRPQQGLTRFTTPANRAPQKMGPRATGASTAPKPYARPNGGPGKEIGFEANYDLDDRTLSYDVYRNGQRIGGLNRVPSTFYQRPWLRFHDATVDRNRRYTYQVRARDSDGNAVLSPKVTG